MILTFVAAILFWLAIAKRKTGYCQLSIVCLFIDIVIVKTLYDNLENKKPGQ